MKRCLQFVALSIAVLLAMPPALARELCLQVQGAQGMAGDDCCAGASHSVPRLTGLKGSTRAAQADNSGRKSKRTTREAPSSSFAFPQGLKPLRSEGLLGTTKLLP